MPVSFEVVKGPYFQDLLNQPQALRATLISLRDSAAFDRIAGECEPSRYQRIVLTGMGSSFCGLHPLSIELAQHGWTPMMLETSELIHYYPHLLTPATLVVAVSQSGRSAETVRLLELNSGKATIIGVTNHADSPLAIAADFTVLTAAGDEFSVSCKTYVCTLLALNVLAVALCNLNAPQRLREMDTAPASVERYLQNWQSHVSEFVGLLESARHLFLVGRGSSLAAAGTGALIIKESDHVHAEGMSSAAFRHGPFDMLDPTVFVGIFAGNSRTRELNDNLLEDVLRTGAQALSLSADAHHAACRLPESSETLTPIFEILPAQMMTLALAAIKNREPGRFAYSSKITTTE